MFLKDPNKREKILRGLFNLGNTVISLRVLSQHCIILIAVLRLPFKAHFSLRALNSSYSHEAELLLQLHDT